MTDLKDMLTGFFKKKAQAPLHPEPAVTAAPAPIVAVSSPREAPDRKLVIVDIGCRWGFAERFISDDSLFRVYGFDPDVEECQRLNRLYEGSDISIVPLGLAGTEGKRRLYLTHEPACSSLIEPDAALTLHYPALRCAQHVSTVEVDTTTLDAWAAANEVSHIDYIKVDTQGTELEILQGGIQILQSTRCLEVEVEFNPIYVGQPVFSDVDLFLRSQGFVLWKLTNQVHYSRDGAPDTPIGDDTIYYDERQQVKHPIYGGQLYWANAHYVNSQVLALNATDEAQKLRDISLFETLGMPDVTRHLHQPTATASAK